MLTALVYLLLMLLAVLMISFPITCSKLYGLLAYYQLKQHSYSTHREVVYSWKLIGAYECCFSFSEMPVSIVGMLLCYPS